MMQCAQHLTAAQFKELQAKKAELEALQGKLLQLQQLEVRSRDATATQSSRAAPAPHTGVHGQRSGIRQCRQSERARRTGRTGRARRQGSCFSAARVQLSLPQALRSQLAFFQALHQEANNKLQRLNADQAVQPRIVELDDEQTPYEDDFESERPVQCTIAKPLTLGSGDEESDDDAADDDDDGAAAEARAREMLKEQLQTLEGLRQQHQALLRERDALQHLQVVARTLNMAADNIADRAPAWQQGGPAGHAPRAAAAPR